jgi:MSHA biogenesis protein MshL
VKPHRAGNFGLRGSAWILGLGLLLALSGCTTLTAPPPNVVLDAIQRELGNAAKPANSDKSAVEQALLPPLQLEVPKPAEARFDIAVQNAPASQVYNAIVVGTPFSMLVPPDLTGNVTLNLKKVTVRDVLDALRDIYGYDYRVQGDRIFPQSLEVQTRVFHVNYLAGQRQGSTNVSLNSTSITSSGSSGTSPVPAISQNVAPQGAPASGSTGRSGGGSTVTTDSKNDFWGELKLALDAIVGDAKNVVINRSSGVVLVIATPIRLREVEKYIKTTAGVIERQVMLEAKIIDVSLSEEYQGGVNWAAFGTARRNGSFVGNYAIGSQAPSTSLTASGAITAPKVTVGAAAGAIATGVSRGFYGMAFQSGEFAAMLNFLEGQGTVHVLSSPRVATLNNQKAVLKVGIDEFYVTNVSTTTTTGTGPTTTSPSVTLQPFFSGIALDVTPQIDAHDQIILHVHPSISTVSEKTRIIDLGSGGSLSLPLAASSINESDAIVRVRDGQIVAIGGLMRQRQVGDRSGLPGMADTAASLLLGHRGRSMTKSELVILIKPTVIRDDRDWLPALQEINQRLQEYAPAQPVHIIRP